MEHTKRKKILRESKKNNNKKQMDFMYLIHLEFSAEVYKYKNNKAWNQTHTQSS